MRSPDGWTRKFFGNPEKSKPNMNAMIAHGPQHLNVSLVDRGYFAVWYKYDNAKILRVKGQIHDSLLFQIHKDHLHLLEDVRKIYDETSRITIRGKEMFIPSTIDGPKTHWK